MNEVCRLVQPSASSSPRIEDKHRCTPVHTLTGTEARLDHGISEPLSLFPLRVLVPELGLAHLGYSHSAPLASWLSKEARVST
jgi:hypothetical protein